MKIPNGPSGVPTVSASQFRKYGAGGVVLDEQEVDEGCPRLYEATYCREERLVEAKPYELLYGSLIHEVLYLMEEEGLNPDEALQKAWDPTMPFEWFEEARGDLQQYVERGATPMDRFATLGVELDLDAVLFVHPEYGEIRYRGKIDWVGVDPDDPRVLHVVDFKTNRSPFKNEALAGDVQMRGYHWLIAQHARKWVPTGPVRIVTHLDAIKFREVEIAYSDDQIDDWHSWAVALVMAILNDEKAEPHLNTYCPRCPIRSDCPLFQALPATGQTLAKTKDQAAAKGDEELLRWRDEANRVRLVLEKSVKAIDDDLKERAAKNGPLVIGDDVWEKQIAYDTLIDMRALHRALGNRFYDAVSTSKAAITRVTKGVDPTTLAAAWKAVTDIATGTKIVRKKVK